MLNVLEYRNDRWENLGKSVTKSISTNRKQFRIKKYLSDLLSGRLLAGRSVDYASGLSFQNQLMIIGGERDNPESGVSSAYPDGIA